MNARLLTRLIILILLTSGFSILLRDASAQIRVSRISSADMLTGRKGIVYNLPRSVIDIEIPVTKLQSIPGPLAEYAGEFLGASDVITKNTTEYSLGDIKMQCRTEPDPSQVFIIEKEEKSQGEVWVSFGPGGKRLVLESFLKETGPKGFDKWDNALYQSLEPQGLFKRYSESATKEVIDTIVRKVSIDTLTIEETTLKRSLVPYPDRDKAQEAADRIHQIESDLYNLLIGYQETAYPKDALEFMYDKLMEERGDYISLFTGYTVKESLVFHYSVIPDASQQVQEYPLAGFSTSEGLLEADEHDPILLILSVDDQILKTDPSVGQIPKGIVYGLPVVLPLKVMYKGREMAFGRYTLLQYGPLLTLPPEFKKVELDLSTGSVLSVVME